MDYQASAIEKKWQQRWEKDHAFRAIDFDPKPKYYALVEFPYPSGSGMHVGHIRAYASLEVIARKRRMEGYNVLFPIGFDAFGLPTENFAMKENIHPRIVTDQNIQHFKAQLKAIGFSFDYDRIVDTTDPKYYRWTQWIFLKLYEQGLAYRNKTYVNYCPSCQVVLANEESQGGECDRCGSPIVQKEKDVWFLKITAYAQKLLDGLKDLETLPRIALEQENWIGRSEGALVTFLLAQSDDTLEVFTTRPDTLFGATFMVIAPENPLLTQHADRLKNPEAIEAYQAAARLKTEFERTQLVKDKTGVRLEGIEAINPLTQQPMPIFIADYVMMGYGTGAIMAVPGHDSRDYAFAKAYDLPIVEVIAGGDLSVEAYTDTDEGVLINSDFINGMDVKTAIQAMNEHLEREGLGQKMVNFKMKDWAFNRQRYWGEPIPIVHLEDGTMEAISEKELPLELPYLEDFKPSAEGASPLAKATDWLEVEHKGKPALRETDTMPQWAGSSWYFLRYTDPHNEHAFASYDKLKYWLPVDWYNGGMEHVTRHVIYSRFWHRFLYDQGHVPTPEPYKKRTAQGLILGPDGEKMSKSKGNVVNPMEIVDHFGADTLRVYILFIGDYEQPTPWSDAGVKGARRFLDKVWRLKELISETEDSSEFTRLLNQTIAEVDHDCEHVKFNTAIAKLMTLTNAAYKQGTITQQAYETLLKLLNPFAPHVSEELYESLGHKESLVHAPYPKADASKMQAETVTIVLSVNGKVRAKLDVEASLDEASIIEKALAEPRLQPFLEGKTIVKRIVVPQKLINFVVKDA